MKYWIFLFNTVLCLQSQADWLDYIPGFRPPEEIELIRHNYVTKFYAFYLDPNPPSITVRSGDHIKLAYLTGEAQQLYMIGMESMVDYDLNSQSFSSGGMARRAMENAQIAFARALALVPIKEYIVDGPQNSELPTISMRKLKALSNIRKRLFVSEESDEVEKYKPFVIAVTDLDGFEARNALTKYNGTFPMSLEVTFVGESSKVLLLGEIKKGISNAARSVIIRDTMDLTLSDTAVLNNNDANGKARSLELSRDEIMKIPGDQFGIIKRKYSINNINDLTSVVLSLNYKGVNLFNINVNGSSMTINSSFKQISLCSKFF